MIMGEQTPYPLVVELWYAEAPDLGDPRLLDALRSLSPAAQLQMDSVVVPHSEGPAPLLTVIMRGSPLGEGRKGPAGCQPDLGLGRCRSRARALPAKRAGH